MRDQSIRYRNDGVRLVDRPMLDPAFEGIACVGQAGFGRQGSLPDHAVNEGSVRCA